jgi:tRNA-dihydrouridine synthase
MLPAAQIVQSYEHALKLHNMWKHGEEESNFHPEQIQTLVDILQKQPQISFVGAGYTYVLEELLHPAPGPVALQLGGRSPQILAKAAAIATAFGYGSINLNCGCPSTTVASARQTGAALMKEPELVADCLEQMSHAMDEMNPNAELSVKHRLGVAMADSYDAAWDRAHDDEQAYQSCRDFCRIVGVAGKVSKVHVHARLAILGLAAAATTAAATDNTKESSVLWAPDAHGQQQEDEEQSSENKSKKVNHKRVQYAAKRQARQATIQNRNVPPLRPQVVGQIADDFPHLQVISNGGISSISQIQKRISGTNIVGAMVGRAAINHPCSFAGVDSILWNKDDDDHSTKKKKKNTRQQALEKYIEYCEVQEERITMMLRGMPSASSRAEWMNHRKKLIAAPFHLFMGEDGNSAYQRRLRKLLSRAERHPAPSMLKAAMSEVPTLTLNKPVDDHVPWEQIETYEFTKRSGAMQRTIY